MLKIIKRLLIIAPILACSSHVLRASDGNVSISIKTMLERNNHYISIPADGISASALKDLIYASYNGKLEPSAIKKINCKGIVIDLNDEHFVTPDEIGCLVRNAKNILIVDETASLQVLSEDDRIKIEINKKWNELDDIWKKLLSLDDMDYFTFRSYASINFPEYKDFYHRNYHSKSARALAEIEAKIAELRSLQSYEEGL